MANLTNVLRAFNASVHFLVGSVALSIGGAVIASLEDDEFYSLWQTVEQHFCATNPDLGPTPWESYLPHDTIRGLLAEYPADQSIFEGLAHLRSYQRMVGQSIRVQLFRARKSMDIEEYQRKGENPQHLAGVNRLQFPTPTLARQYYFSRESKLPPTADLLEEEAVIKLRGEPAESVENMIDHIQKIINGQPWEDTNPDANQPELPSLASVPVAPATGAALASYVPDLLKECIEAAIPQNEGATNEGLEQGTEYNIIRARADLMRMWDENINTTAYWEFQNRGLTKDHYGKNLAKTIWNSTPWTCHITEFILAVWQAINGNKRKFKTNDETRFGLIGAVTMILARKPQLKLVGTTIHKKR